MLKNLNINVVLICVGTLFFTGSAAAKEQRIGMIDAQFIMENMPQMVALESTLRMRFKDKIDEIEKLKTEAKYNYDRLQRDSSSMRSKQIEELQNTLLGQKRDLDKKNRVLREAMRNDYEYEKNKILKIIAKITKKVSKEEGYDYILRRENLAYAVDNANNISAKVLAQAKKIN